MYHAVRFSCSMFSQFVWNYIIYKLYARDCVSRYISIFFAFTLVYVFCIFEGSCQRVSDGLSAMVASMTLDWLLRKWRESMASRCQIYRTWKRWRCKMRTQIIVPTHCWTCLKSSKSERIHCCWRLCGRYTSQHYNDNNTANHNLKISIHVFITIIKII